MTAREGVVAIAEASGLDRSVIGGKATSLVQLAELGLRVPPAFVITTDVCHAVLRDGHFDPRTVQAIDAAVIGLEEATGCRFGGTTNPLLLSVRSGASASMPGMMDTILDVGFGPGTRAALAARDGEAFARSCHLRFLTGFAAVTLGAPTGEADDPDELAAGLAHRVPAEPRHQLLEAIGGVVRSWGNDRAAAYRDRHGTDHAPATAVVVQAMVFGDRAGPSGSGVAFSRDPNTGEPGLYGDFLPGAQGQDVAAGTHRTAPLAALSDLSPAAFAELQQAVTLIEAATRDMVDVEFTVEDGTLHFLQHRPGARAAAAAVRIAVDLVDEGTISVSEAMTRVTPAQLERARRPTVADDAGSLLATGLGASPGVATGEVCLAPDHVAEHVAPVILVRTDTSPDDVRGMTASAGALTARGGLVSHAALVARELDLPTVVGVEDLEIDLSAGTISVGGRVLAEGDQITVDGATGRVHAGAAAVVAPATGEHLARFHTWLREHGPDLGRPPGPA